MKRSFLTLVFAVLLISASGSTAALAQPASNLMNVEIEATDAFVAFGNAVKSGNYEEATRYFMEDPRFSWVEDGTVKFDQPAQIIRAFRGITDKLGILTVYRRPLVYALNDTQVMVFSKFLTTLKKGTPEEFKYQGAFTGVMQKSEKGWYFVTGHTSTKQLHKFE